MSNTEAFLQRANYLKTWTVRSPLSTVLCALLICLKLSFINRSLLIKINTPGVTKIYFSDLNQVTIPEDHLSRTESQRSSSLTWTTQGADSLCNCLVVQKKRHPRYSRGHLFQAWESKPKHTQKMLFAGFSQWWDWEWLPNAKGQILVIEPLCYSCIMDSVLNKHRNCSTKSSQTLFIITHLSSIYPLYYQPTFKHLKCTGTVSVTLIIWLWKLLMKSKLKQQIKMITLLIYTKKTKRISTIMNEKWW